MMTIQCPRCNLTSEPKALVCVFCGYVFNTKIMEYNSAIMKLRKLMKNTSDTSDTVVLNMAIQLFEKEIINEENMRRLREI
jgi:ribosomal protein L37E